MDQRDLDRIRLLSARFHELQGLRVAITGVCIALVVGTYVIASPAPTNNGAMIALLAAFVPAIPAMRWANRYYASTFGRQVWSPPRHVRLVMTSYMVVAWCLHTWIPAIPAGAPTAMIVAAASVWVAIRDWPWRAYYLLATAAVAIGLSASAAVGGLVAPHLTLSMMFLLLASALVPIGLLDHLLLVKLIRDARAAQAARPNPAGERA